MEMWLKVSMDQVVVSCQRAAAASLKNQADTKTVVVPNHKVMDLKTWVLLLPWASDIKMPLNSPIICKALMPKTSSLQGVVQGHKRITITPQITPNRHLSNTEGVKQTEVAILTQSNLKIWPPLITPTHQVDRINTLPHSQGGLGTPTLLMLLSILNTFNSKVQPNNNSDQLETVPPIIRPVV